MIPMLLEKGGISIHALREEGDGSSSSRWRAAVYFYPRPPRGGRRRITEDNVPAKLFLSTPSARRATVLCVFLRVSRAISIHALREEGDRSTPRLTSMLTYFYPRPPRGGRPVTK